MLGGLLYSQASPHGSCFEVEPVGGAMELCQKLASVNSLNAQSFASVVLDVSMFSAFS